MRFLNLPDFKRRYGYVLFNMLNVFDMFDVLNVFDMFDVLNVLKILRALSGQC